jgi:hypothetical protein
MRPAHILAIVAAVVPASVALVDCITTGYSLGDLPFSQGYIFAGLSISAVCLIGSLIVPAHPKIADDA